MMSSIIKNEGLVAGKLILLIKPCYGNGGGGLALNEIDYGGVGKIW